MYLIEDDEEEIEKVVHSAEVNPAQHIAHPAQVPISTEFKCAFALVMSQFACSEDERAEAKALALADLDNAIPCYLAMQRLILGEAQGINERIRDAIAQQRDREEMCKSC